MNEKNKGLLGLMMGIILLIGSIVFFLSATSTVNDYETPLGQMARVLDPAAQEDYEAAQSIQIVSGIVIVLGIILSIFGLILVTKD